MVLYILNADYEQLALVDEFISLIWTDRFTECGDFELQLPASAEALSLFRLGRYAETPDSDRTMVIEKQSLSTDADGRRILTISGRSLESILDRRIIWGEDYLTGNLQNAVQRILNDNAISPEIAARTIPGLVFVPTNDARITSLEVEDELKGDDILEAIQSQCAEQDVGLKLIRDGTTLRCSLYMGEDHSYRQTANRYVVFSPGFDNLSESQYVKDSEKYKNAALVVGQEPTNSEDEKKISVAIGTASGLDRREVCINLKSTDEDEILVPDVESRTYSLDLIQYKFLLAAKGTRELLREYRLEELFEGTTDESTLYRYGVDYQIGDIVQLENEFGQGGAAVVDEMILTEDSSGRRRFPTFRYIGG